MSTRKQNVPSVWDALMNDASDHREYPGMVSYKNIDRWGIGFNQMLGTLRAFSAMETVSYPPYNITRESNTEYRIVIAVAGFTKKDLSIYVEDNILRVGSIRNDDDSDRKEDRQFIHQGIAARHFTLNYALAEHVEVKEAELSNGLLVIDLALELPEEKKPKAIPIKG